MEYNPRFDALRALCVLGVMAFHWQGILQFGWIGVQTFFVLSGFLITGILERSKERYRTLDYFFVFEWRRFLRICPAYFGYLGVLGFLFWITRQPDSLPQAAPYLSTFTLNIERLFHGYQNHQAYTHLWSLAVEFQFYLVWPVIVYFANRKQLSQSIYLFILLGPLLRLLTQVSMSHIYGSPDAVGNAVYNSPLSHIDAFATGAAVALGLPGFRSRFAQKFFLTAGIALCAGLVILFCCASNGKAVPPDSLGYPINLPYFYSPVWAYTLINLSSAFLLGVLGTQNLPVFGSGPMQWLGRISYGLYLFHLPVQSLLKPFISGKPWFAPESILLFLISILATVLVAWLSYEFWEVHFLKLKDLYQPKPVFSREAATNLSQG
jgi:peptidoglycan/LPS O-acetylase OafA/YrhL